jgi:membrane-associated phospholipid phosphatase
MASLQHNQSTGVRRIPPGLLPILFLLSAASATWAQKPTPDHRDSETPRTLSAKLGLDLGSLVSGSNLVILGAAGAVSAIAWEETDEHQGALQRSLGSASIEGLADLGNLYGSGWFVGGASVGAMAAGELGDNEALTRFGVDLGRSFVYSAVATSVIKLTVNRTRPSGGPYSFPSGHTTTAFSTVPVVWHHAGWVAGMGAGTLACITAMSRMEDNSHYASDVIFGAAVGLVFGRAVISQRRSSDWLDHLAVSGQSVAVVWSF